MRYLIDTKDLPQTLDVMITPMMLTNEKGVPAYVNCSFQTQIGYNIEQLPDKISWFEKAYPDTYYREKVMNDWNESLITALKKGEDSMHVISKIRCADGLYRWFNVHQHSIENKYAITFLNVDELKQQVEGFVDKVQQENTLLAIVAHDVKSPLNSIKQIIDGYENLNLCEDDVAHMFVKISRQMDYVMNMLTSLLVRTGDERDRFTEQREFIHLQSFFSKYLCYYQDRLEDQHIRLALELPDDASAAAHLNSSMQTDTAKLSKQIKKLNL
ncbi:MAG TPA: hypothetical protein VGM63_07945, partial [Mucilaginibacter sp.]